MFLLPVFLSHWQRATMRAIAPLLIVPVPFIIDQFTKPAWVQLTVGSVYAWALVLCLGMLLGLAWSRAESTGPATVEGGVRPA
jgi:hypothetical protein